MSELVIFSSISSKAGVIRTRTMLFYGLMEVQEAPLLSAFSWSKVCSPCPQAFRCPDVEAGPCRIVDGNTTTFHPDSWNSQANMFFIDQPVGVGWSYADYGEAVVRRCAARHSAAR